MGIDQYFYAAVALFFVLTLIVLLSWAMRRMGLGGLAATSSRQRRLGIVEVLPLDAKRRLVLVRRDDREHLLLLSALGDLVVDAGPGGGHGGSGFRGALSEVSAPAPTTLDPSRPAGGAP